MFNRGPGFQEAQGKGSQQNRDCDDFSIDIFQPQCPSYPVPLAQDDQFAPFKGWQHLGSAILGQNGFLLFLIGSKHCYRSVLSCL